MLACFRSQHERQFWVGALTTILDTRAIVMTFDLGPSLSRARLPFTGTTDAARYDNEGAPFSGGFVAS